MIRLTHAIDQIFCNFLTFLSAWKKNSLNLSANWSRSRSSRTPPAQPRASRHRREGLRPSFAGRPSSFKGSLWRVTTRANWKAPAFRPDGNRRAATRRKRPVATRKSNCRSSCPPTTSSRASRNSSSRTNRRHLHPSSTPIRRNSMDLPGRNSRSRRRPSSRNLKFNLSRKCFKENLKNPLVRYFRSRIAYFNKNCNYIRFEKFVRLS